ncbi:hypothetical protein BU24DRAFT_101042 [Aaosphaeria arxii CBS 175.79]|uniref:Uncharacterized protein n=1 Tax=Aaosphaeria arxii CBS 175.79 TaxID=1450172 RepID=A0A6A5Y045_9PLEO|nr:uncharacterized protein BU24DRAFT_101042 [Aaosphaeria arxii CBS 175.79]KAF2018629.1 hypothetical protein BU24DRAFT_101042 [Aaosphaeria arxii CBS 175.79]
MDTLTSWAIFIAIVGAGYWYYTQNSGSGKQRGRTLQRPAATSAKGADTNWIEAESKSTKSNAKSSKAKAQAPRKSVKKAVQDVGNKVEASLSAASSNGGADADDDLSPVASPSVATTSSFKAPSGRDVSDMLESRGPAPGVMSIKASEKPARQNKSQPRPETPQETKKQRQNRKKVEEAKAQREADEKQRQILLEQQRRTAREARGEPAKNGLQQAQIPDSNAWTTVRSGGSSAPAVAPVAAAQNGGLLDTFEPETAPSAAKKTKAKTSTNGPQYNGLPSEEEQVRMAMEDSAWTTVAKPKKTRKTKAADDEGSDSGVAQEAASVPAPVSAPVAAPVKKAAVKPEAPRQSSRYGLLAEPTNQGHELDSDWPVV